MQLLARAPMEFTPAARKSPVVLQIPMPDGGFARFRVQQSPISLPDPSGKHSDFLSFSGQGIDDRTATLRGDISPAGFHAQIISIKETVYVDPYAANDQVNCISYYRKDLSRQGAPFQCFAGLPDSLPSFQTVPAHLRSTLPHGANGAMLSTVRAAFAATGEYTNFFRQAGDTDDQAKGRALDALKVTMNRVNGIWERDAAVRYMLLADATELSIIYPDPATDPYTNVNDAGAMATDNQTNLDNVVGDANYDMGHVVAMSGAGGVGAAGVCVTGQKAMGATASDNPVGDAFDVDYVAHEVIHQWDGSHTFNDNANGSCMGNWEQKAAYEPGSGSTVSSYAGICDSANLQKNSDDYFHGGSIVQILDYLTNNASCLAKTATGNTPPTVTAPASFTIPQTTPFTLTATASDPDGDAVTYSWEEFDLGPASPPESDDGMRPILRPYKPVTTPSRTFPSLTYILNNANAPPATFMGTSATGSVCADGTTCITGEVMPVTTRTMAFRVTVRDNRAGGGGINDATTMVNVRADSGPFVVTAPNTNVTVTGGSQLTVTWNVANTTAAPVSAANVKISYSTDGGMTFPTVLSASTPNDGTEAVTVPNGDTTTARIKVEGVDNIFFDVSDANFTVSGSGPTPTPSPSPSSSPTPTPTPASGFGNISTRLSVGTGDEVAIGGFIIAGKQTSAGAQPSAGTQPKKVIIEGKGPSLGKVDPPVPGFLADPNLELHDGTGATIASDDNWHDETNEQEIMDSGLAPTEDAESAILMTLNPGNYTAIERGANGSTGIGLVEIYDLDPTVDTTLANISTRGQVGTGDNVLIGGIIIVGTAMQRVIVRAIGPSLLNFDPPVPGALADPILELHNPDGSILATNDDWRDTQQDEIIATGLPPTDDLESAIVATLAPGPYTAIVYGFDNSTGDAVVEAYALAPAP